MQRLRILLSLLGVLLILASAVQAEDKKQFRRTITVNGMGRAFSPPDMATIQTGVVTYGSAASEALSANNKVMVNIMDVLEKNHIASKDVQTANLNISPEYKRDDRGRKEPEIVGYRVTNQLRVRVHNLKNLGEVIDALVRAGSNQVSGIRFGIDDPSEVLRQARNRAIVDARSRAGLYAQAAGVRIGKVLAITEQSIDFPRPQRLARGFAAEAVSSVPVATGEQEFHVRIMMVFALEDKI
jgi:uncharacterized protein YggE